MPIIAWIAIWHYHYECLHHYTKCRTISQILSLPLPRRFVMCIIKSREWTGDDGPENLVYFLDDWLCQKNLPALLLDFPIDFFDKFPCVWSKFVSEQVMVVPQQWSKIASARWIVIFSSSDGTSVGNALLVTFGIIRRRCQRLAEIII